MPIVVARVNMLSSHKAIATFISAPISEGARFRTPSRLKGAKVRVVTDAVVDASDMNPGELAVECNLDGSINEHVLTQIALDVEEGGSTVPLLVADAWKISSIYFKTALLGALQRGPPKVAHLMDGLVKCWGSGQGRTYRDSQAEEDCIEGAVAREPFDFTATAYSTFVNEPEQFGWAKGTPQFKAAVTAMRRPLQDALESETDGAWSEHSDGFVLEDEADDGGGSGSGSAMSTRRFNAMLRECSAALKVRQHRNQAAAHPLFNSIPNARTEMLDMYRKVVAARTPIVRGFINLAKASIAHVEQELAKRAVRDGAVHAECLLEVVQL